VVLALWKEEIRVNTATYAILLLCAIFVLIFMFLFITMAGPSFWFGIKLRVARLKRGSNVGLVSLRNKAGDIGLPDVVDLRKDKYTKKIDGVMYEWPIVSEHFEGAKYMNTPWTIFDVDDSKTNVGVVRITYMDSDEEGNPTQRVSQVKPSITMKPSLIRALIKNDQLTGAIQDLFNKHKTQIYILAGIGIGIAFSVYVGWELINTHIPQLIENQERIINLFEQSGGIRLP
jgi:hypothetical protein